MKILENHPGDAAGNDKRIKLSDPMNMVCLLSPSRAQARRKSTLKYPKGYTLAGASIPVVVDVNVDGVLEVAAELFRLLLGQGIPGND